MINSWFRHCFEGIVPQHVINNRRFFSFVTNTLNQRDKSVYFLREFRLPPDNAFLRCGIKKRRWKKKHTRIGKLDDLRDSTWPCECVALLIITIRNRTRFTRWWRRWNQPPFSRNAVFLFSNQYIYIAINKLCIRLQGVKIKMDEAGNILIRRYSKSNVYIKSTASNICEETSTGSDILKLSNSCLDNDKIFKVSPSRRD